MIRELHGFSILGDGRSSSVGESFKAVNPATGEKLEPAYHHAALADVERAAVLAWEAFEAFDRDGGAKKAALLRRMAGELESDTSEIIERAHLETALPLSRLQGELIRTCNQLRLFADLAEEGSWVDARIDHGDPARTPVPKPDVRSMLRPLGPVAVFGASNFPLAFSVAGGDTASALAAGCPVIVKAHPLHPGTSELAGMAVQRAASACGVHPGVFSLLFDAGFEKGLALVRHPAVKAVGFTGSRAGGRAIMAAASERPEPIPVFAEMGSVNPVFIFPEALRERGREIATSLHASVTLGVGQFCTNPGLVVIPAAGSEAFLHALRESFLQTPDGTMLSAAICERYRGRIKHTVAIPEIRVDRRDDVEEYATNGVATLLRTTGLAFLAHPELMEETFGPSTLLVQCESIGEMIAIAESLEGQLTATVHGDDEDLRTYSHLSESLERKAGRLIVNGFPTGVEVCHAMVHGGPYPATSDGRSTSVGTRAIARFTRPVCYQDFPGHLLPQELREENPLGIQRLVDGKWM